MRVMSTFQCPINIHVADFTSYQSYVIFPQEMIYFQTITHVIGNMNRRPQIINLIQLPIKRIVT